MDRRLVTIALAALAAFLYLGGSAAADDADPGKAAYELNCSSCHGLSGKGDGPIAAALNPKPRDFTAGEFKFDADRSGAPGDDGDLRLVIKNGAMAYGGSPLMAAWPTLTDEQLDQIIAYIRTLKQ